MHYLMPLRGVLTLHSGCNMGANKDVTLFFGLSGTGACAAAACAFDGDDAQLDCIEYCYERERHVSSGGLLATLSDVTHDRVTDTVSACANDRSMHGLWPGCSGLMMSARMSAAAVMSACWRAYISSETEKTHSAWRVQARRRCRRTRGGR